VTFEEYVRQRGAALVRLARLLVGDRQLGEDLAQEVLARAYARWDRILRADRPDVYLRRMLVNAHISRRRLRSSHEHVGVPDADRPRAGALDAEVVERDALWRVVVTLPRQQRAAVVLRYYEDLDDTAIAEILDCSPVTVRTHVARALATLRERMGLRGDQLRSSR
jgi:RNA polymerase sigma-70 factor (sigma-E family)